MKQFINLAAALAAGLIGGILGTRTIGTLHQPGENGTIRARSFELVNEVGQTISLWGVDNNQNLVLTFGSRGLLKGGSLPGRTPGNLRDPDNQVTAIGLQANDMPWLKMSGADKKTRVRLYLTMDGKPIMLMEDETGPRLCLGVEQSDTPGPNDNDWSLVFKPEVARIGLHAEERGGETYVQGGVLVRPDKLKYP